MPTRSASAPAKEEETGLAPLNFRVSAEFRREFKTYAAAHDLKLNKLLALSSRPTCNSAATDGGGDTRY